MRTRVQITRTIEVTAENKEAVEIRDVDPILGERFCTEHVTIPASAIPTLIEALAGFLAQRKTVEALRKVS